MDRPNRYVVIQCQSLSNDKFLELVRKLIDKKYEFAKGVFLGRLVVACKSEQEETLLRLQLGNIKAQGFDSFEDLMEWKSEYYLGE